jgi:hypothetical protein
VIKGLLHIISWVFIFGPAVSYCQDRMEFGIRYEAGYHQLAAFEFRIPVARMIKLNLGGAYSPGINRTDSWNWVQGDWDNESEIDLVRRIEIAGREAQFHFGSTFKTPSKILSVTTDLTMGVRYELVTHESVFIENGTAWWNPVYIANPGLPMDLAKKHSLAMIPGGRVGLHFSFPLSKRIYFDLGIINLIYGRFYILHMVESDPLDEFRMWSWMGFDGLGMDMRAQAGFRIELGKGRTFERIFKTAEERKTARAEKRATKPKKERTPWITIAP